MTTHSIKRSRTGSYFTYRNALVGNSPTYGSLSVSGGMVASDSTYYYRVFTSSGTLTVSSGNLTADILVVAGGGGAGFDSAGGGGAGGLQGFASQSLISGSYTVTVGAGGAAGTVISVPASNGANSQFGALTASIGGGGGGGKQATGNSGGSGGGSGHDATTSRPGGAGTTGQGFAGGTNFTTAGSGGGGASAVGANAANNTGGNGGSGSSDYSSWGLATATGQNVSGTVYYSGGGGGGTYISGGTRGTGGNGGGGNGGVYNSSGSAGTANTGGGGGSNGDANFTTAFPGGSGIVIVRYLKTLVFSTQGDYELLGTVTLTSNQASVTFTAIPQDYTHLQLRLATRDSLANAYNPVNVTFNSSATGYSFHYITGVNGSPGAGNGVSQSFITIDGFQGNASDANNFGVGIFDILDYSSSIKNKTIRSFSGRTGTDPRNWLSSGAWYNTSPVTSITITDTYNAASGGVFIPTSTFRLYGVRA
jgi:hypothetical protein